MRRLALAALVCAALALTAAARDVPFLSGRVNDDAHLLDAGAAQSLETTLKNYEDKSGRQIVVLTIPSLEGDALEDFAIKVARTWKLGQKGQNNGILLLVARDDHKARLEVGYGLEGTFPDVLAGRIIRDELVPRFRSNDYAGGITAGVNAIISVLDGNYSPPARALQSRGRNDFAAMDTGQKVLASLFVFGVLGLFEFVGLIAPGVGWFLYFFLIPFWAAFPMALWGARFGMGLLGAHLIAFPILKMILGRTDWGQKMAKNVHSRHGGVYFGGGGGSSEGGGWSGGDSGGFSGGGGDFGGGGASGSW